MKRVPTFLRWVVLSLGAVLLLIILGVGLFTRTERFRELLRGQLVSALNATLRGEVSLERIEGSIWSNLTLYNLAIRHQHIEILQVPRLLVRYTVLSLLQGRVQVSRIEGVKPTVRLKRDAEGNWNVLEALSSPTEQSKELEKEPTEGAGLTILLDNVVLQDADINVGLSDDKKQTYRIGAINLDARIGVLPSGFELEVRRLTARGTAEGLPKLQAETSLAYQNTSTPATARVSDLTLATPHSRIQLAGEIRNLETLETEATLLIENLAAADLAMIVPGPSLKEDLSGQVQVSGSLADLQGTLMLAAADARITADLRADFSRDAPQYQGTITSAHLDIQKLVELEGIAGIADGTLQADGVGISLAELNGETTLQIRALQVGEWQIGNVSLRASLEHERGTLNGEVSGDLGHAKWQGEIYLAEGPRYELAMSAEHLDIKKIMTQQEPVEGDFNLKGSLKGKGLALSEMDTRAEIDILSSTLGPVEVKRGRLDVQIANRRIRIAEGVLTAKDTALTIQGEMGTTLEEAGRLSYSLQVAHLASWLSLAGQEGAGALTLTGTAQGNLANLQVQGELIAEGLRLEGTSIERGVVAFDLHEIGQTQLQGTLVAELKNLLAGVALQSVTTAVTLPQEQPPSAQLARIQVQVEDAEARPHHLNVEVSYQPEHLTVHLREFFLTLPDGIWQLAQPARIVQNKRGFVIESVVIANREQQIQVGGSLSPTGKQDLLVQIEQVALSVLRPLLPQEPAIKGLLSARVQLSGTAAAPQIEGTTNIANLQIAGQDYADLSMTTAYTEKQATLELNFQQDDAHALRATGTLPLSLSWADGLETQILGDMDVHIFSSGLSLAFLNALSDPAIQDVAGQITLDILLQGPISQPLPRGTFQLHDGQAVVTPLGMNISAITIKGAVSPEQVRIEQISAQSKKGQLQGSGVVAMENYFPERLAVSLSADRWPAIWTRQYKVEIGGQVSAEGPLTAPHVKGRLEVQRATLRPALTFLDDKPVQRDDTIMIVQAKAAPEPSMDEEQEETSQAPPQANTFQNAALDLTVILSRNTLVKHSNARLELAGEVRAAKEKGGNVTLAGVIEVGRGWVGFQGRRFILSRGQVVFTGGTEINPNLDIVAEYRLPQYLVQVAVDGTATKPTLQLKSTPELDQADILALLLFGKPTDELGQREQGDLQQQALALTGGYVAAAVGESVSQALGIEDLGIDLQEIDLTGGRVGLGGYLSPKTRVSTYQDLTGQKGQEVSIEYQLAPHWEIHTSTSSTGSSGADIIWRKQY